MANINKILDEVDILLGLCKKATKSHTEREDEATEKLVRRDPKKRPPRSDLRKNRIQVEGDKDLEGLNRGDKGDPDLSRRDRKMAELEVKFSRLAFRVLARLDEKQLSEKARANLKNRKYKNRDTDQENSFETALKNENKDAVFDYKKELASLKFKQQEKAEKSKEQEEQEQGVDGVLEEDVKTKLNRLRDNSEALDQTVNVEGDIGEALKKVEEAKKKLDEASGQGPAKTKVMEYLEQLEQSGDDARLESVFRSEEKKKQEIIETVSSQDDYAEQIERDLQLDMDTDLTPQEAGEFLANERAKELFVDDLTWSFPSPPSSEDDREEHFEYVWNQSYNSFKNMGSEDRGESDTRLSARALEIEAKLKDGKLDPISRSSLESEMSTLRETRSALNALSLLDGDEPLEGYREVDKSVLEVAELSGSPQMLRLVSNMSSNRDVNSESRKVLQEGLSSLTDSQFSQALGGREGDYGDLLAMLDTDFCPPSIKNDNAEDGECPEPMTDKDKATIRDMVTTLYLDGHTMRRMEIHKSKGKSRGVSKGKSKGKSKSPSEKGKSDLTLEDYQSILLEDVAEGNGDAKDDLRIIHLEEQGGFSTKMGEAIKKTRKTRSDKGVKRGPREKKIVDAIKSELEGDSPADEAKKFIRRKTPSEVREHLREALEKSKMEPKEKKRAIDRLGGMLIEDVEAMLVAMFSDEEEVMEMV